MKLWAILLHDEHDGAVWVESCWDDESTIGNEPGWRGVVDKARQTAKEGGYDMKIVAIIVPDLGRAFDPIEFVGIVKEEA